MSDLLAESAKNSGLPSEEEIRKIVDGALNSAITESWEVSTFAARAILDLIRQAVEREIDRYEAMIKSEQDAAIYWCGAAAKLNERALAAEAALSEESLFHASGERITRKDLNNAYRLGQENGRMFERTLGKDVAEALAAMAEEERDITHVHEPLVQQIAAPGAAMEAQ
jgi:hypothetical protein